MERGPNEMYMEYPTATFAREGFHAMVILKHPHLLFTSGMDVLRWMQDGKTRSSYAQQIAVPGDLPEDCVVWQRTRVDRPGGRRRTDIYIYYQDVVFRSKKSFRAAVNPANSVVTIVD